MQTGAQIQQVWHWRKGDMNDAVLTVTQVQTNGVWGTKLGVEKRLWLEFPKRTEIEFTEHGWIRLDGTRKIAEYMWITGKSVRNLPAMTRVEVDVEGLNSGAQGMPHLEVTQVRVYSADDVQPLPHSEGVSYWRQMLNNFLGRFQACHAEQECLKTAMELLDENQVYLAYGFD